MNDLGTQLSEALKILNVGENDSFTNEEMAKALGVNRRTMSLRRRELEEAGVLEYAGDRKVSKYGRGWSIPTFRFVKEST